ncbi:MAG: ABC transporter permease, partial [Streptomycetaceae bacterium]|nr:ABC transporter permease [Streptomycetaceae bacterium]
LTRAEAGLTRTGSAQVEVILRGMHEAPPGEAGPPPEGPGPAGPAPSADPEPIRAALRADPDTARVTAVGHLDVQVPGRTKPMELTGYDADSSWLGYPVLDGRWFQGGGEAVVPTSFLRASALKIGDRLALDLDGRRTTVRIVGEVFADEEDSIYADMATLTALQPTVPVDGFEVQVKPGVSAGAYAERMSAGAAFASGGASAMSTSEGSETITVLLTLIATLTILLAVVAGLGVLNTVALDTRERAQAIGVLKSLGMTPRQTMAMVITSVVGIGLVGGAAGIPLGVALHHVVAPAMAGTADLRLPDSMVAVYGVPAYAALAASGVVLAVLGAAAPASWAARTRAAAWRTE